jgi:hypothetical protein
MYIVTEMMQQFKNLQAEQNNFTNDRETTKRNRNPPPTPTRLNTSRQDKYLNCSPLTKQARPGTPNSTLKTSQGHPIQNITGGARGAE